MGSSGKLTVGALCAVTIRRCHTRDRFIVTLDAWCTALAALVECRHRGTPVGIKWFVHSHVIGAIGAHCVAGGCAHSCHILSRRANGAFVAGREVPISGCQCIVPSVPVHTSAADAVGRVAALREFAISRATSCTR